LTPLSSDRQFACQTLTSENTIHLVLHGEPDIASAPQFDQHAAAARAAPLSSTYVCSASSTPPACAPSFLCTPAALNESASFPVQRRCSGSSNSLG